MDSSLIISALSLIFFFISLLFSVFLLTVRTTKKISNVLMASFLIVIAIDISVFFYDEYLRLPPSIEMLRIRISFFKNPLLFLYILSVIYSDFKLKRKHLIHLIPFVIGILVLLSRFYLVEESKQIVFFQNYQNMPEIRFIQIFGSILSIIYLIANIYYIRKYKMLLLENYTAEKSLSNYKWLAQLITGIVLVSLITFSKDLFKYTSSLLVINQSRIIMLVGGLIFICWLVLKALYAPKLFKGVDSKVQLVKNILREGIESTEEKEIVGQIERLRKYILKHEPYLNATLTIKDLAEQINIPVRDLSVMINHHLNQHFFDFINEYRIKKAMRILKNNSSKKMTIQEVMYDVGFNSKTPFNTAFKKHTNLTPSQYRKSIDL